MSECPIDHEKEIETETKLLFTTLDEQQQNKKCCT